MIDPSLLGCSITARLLKLIHKKAMKYLGALNMLERFIKEIKFSSVMDVLELEWNNDESNLILGKMVHPFPFVIRKILNISYGKLTSISHAKLAA